MRWQSGIAVVVGESFAEIFFGNCVALGIPCLSATPTDLATLKRAVAADPALSVSIDLDQMQARAGSVSIPLQMPDGARKQLRTGRWDSSAELLDGAEATKSTATKLPYFQHWH